MAAVLNLVFASKTYVEGGSPTTRETSATFAESAALGGASDADTWQMYVRLYPNVMQYLVSYGLVVKTAVVT